MTDFSEDESEEEESEEKDFEEKDLEDEEEKGEDEEEKGEEESGFNTFFWVVMKGSCLCSKLYFCFLISLSWACSSVNLTHFHLVCSSFSKTLRYPLGHRFGFSMVSTSNSVLGSLRRILFCICWSGFKGIHSKEPSDL